MVWGIPLVMIHCFESQAADGAPSSAHMSGNRTGGPSIRCAVLHRTPGSTWSSVRSSLPCQSCLHR